MKNQHDCQFHEIFNENNNVSYQCKELNYLARPKSYYIEDYLYKHLDHDESS